MAFLHVFLFFNLTSGRSRENMTKFYILIFVENAILLGLWWPQRKLNVQYNEIVLTSIIAAFVLSLVFMLAYYLIWHPRVNIRNVCFHFLIQVVMRRDQAENSLGQFSLYIYHITTERHIFEKFKKRFLE